MTNTGKSSHNSLSCGASLASVSLWSIPNNVAKYSTNTEYMIERLFSPARFNLHGFLIKGPAIIIIAGAIVLIAVFITPLFWVFKDARNRNRSGLIAMLFILLTGWPASFIWWFWLRPSSTSKCCSERCETEPEVARRRISESQERFGKNKTLLGIDYRR